MATILEQYKFNKDFNGVTDAQLLESMLDNISLEEYVRLIAKTESIDAQTFQQTIEKIGSDIFYELKGILDEIEMIEDYSESESDEINDDRNREISADLKLTQQGL